MMRQHFLIVTGVTLGVFGLTGCGVSSHLAATPTSHATGHVSGTVHSNGLGRSSSIQSSSIRSTAPANAHSTLPLKVTIVHTAVAAGSDGGLIRFTNIGHSPVSFRGWSTVVGITVSGNLFNRAVHRDTTMFGPDFGQGIQNVPTITLKPGQSAEESFTGTDMPGRNGERATIYHQLLITPPGSTRSYEVSAWLPYYGHDFASSTGIDVSVIARSKDFGP